MSNKNAFWYAALFIAFWALVFTVPETGLARQQNLTILHTNDLHSHLGRFPRLATTIKKIKKVKAKEDEPLLLLDSGDFMIGTLYHLLTPTVSPELTLMDALGYDATTLGNHEFEWGPEALADLITIARENGGGRTVPIVASNIQFSLFDAEDDNLEKLYNTGIIRPYLVKTLSNGLRVGIIGLLGEGAQQEAPGAFPVGFKHNTDFIQRIVDEVKERNVDLLVCLSHSGLDEDKRIAKLTKGIDIIIAGHCHTALLEPIHVGNTLILEAGSYGKYLGKLELSVKGGGVHVRGYRLISIKNSIPEDKAVKEAIKSYRGLINKQILSPIGLEFNSILAKTDFDLVGEDKKMLETNLGDLVTDAMRFAIDSVEPESSVDFTFQPTGFLRDNICKGEITTSDAFQVLSLGRGPENIGGYPLVSFYLNGQEIKRILEISIFLASARGKEYLLQVSGLRFWYNPLRPSFRRITRIQRWDPDAGEYAPLDTDSLYKVGTNLFLINILPSVKRYLPQLTITPKDKDGRPLSLKTLTGKKQVLVDRDPVSTGVQEYKQWQALISYVSHFSDLDGDSVGDVPPPYAHPQARINLDSEEILHYYTRRKDPLIGMGAALLFPSLGHIYANNWYPRGLLFLLLELGSLLVASQESTRAPGLFMLASFKILELKDAYSCAVDYNRRLEETLKVVFLPGQSKAGIALTCRF